MEETLSTPSRRKEFLEDLGAVVADPVHNRIVNAYEGDSPVDSMEAELGKILLEVVQRED